jgi:hypothetical protein
MKRVNNVTLLDNLDSELNSFFDKNIGEYTIRFHLYIDLELEISTVYDRIEMLLEIQRLRLN